MDATRLALADVTITVAGRSLVRNLSLDVGAGEIVTLMGPSGCGKSSLLAWISGSADAGLRARGSIILGGRRIDRLAAEKRRIGILFQDDMLFPHLSVAENLLFAVPRRAGSRRRRQQLVTAALAEVDLEDTAGRNPQTLSGGQKARIALMRALLAEPEAILLDEPFNALDQSLRQDMRRLVFGHIRSRAIPAILVTHDPHDAEATGGRVLTPWAGSG